jgi:hypothetical protein
MKIFFTIDHFPKITHVLYVERNLLFCVVNGAKKAITSLKCVIGGVVFVFMCYKWSHFVPFFTHLRHFEFAKKGTAKQKRC